MTNPTGLKLRYLRVERSIDNPADVPAQPVLTLLKGNKTTTKLVPVEKLTEHEPCIGCIAHTEGDRSDKRIDCFDLPDCETAIYVHANKTNLVRHIAWRLENDK